MKTITLDACAKINLGLDVVGVRGDGYHLLRMIMQQIDLYDTLTFTVRDREENIGNSNPREGGFGNEFAGDGNPVNRFSGESAGSGGKITLTDDSGLSPAGEDNLICRAVRMMMKEYGLSMDVDVRLTKRIPVAAGLAGGSTDAAAAFRAIRDLMVPAVPDSALMELGVRLGADIPYCIAGGTQLAEGIGEKLTELSKMPDCGIVLVKPAQSVSTAQVFRALDALDGYRHPDIDGQIAALADHDLEGLAARCENVLELITGGSLPVIGRIEDFFIKQGALASKMSGSGPSVYAIFHTQKAAETARGAFLQTAMAAGCRAFVCRPADGWIRQQGGNC